MWNADVELGTNRPDRPEPGVRPEPEPLPPKANLEAIASILAADWNRWREYKAENRERFERIDAELLAEHIEIAENWPS